MSTVLVDARLDHWPWMRIPVEVPDSIVDGERERREFIVADAKAEYFRLYGIERSHNEFTAQVVTGSPPDLVEPPEWIAIRKQIGTFGTDRKPVPESPSAGVATAPPKLAAPKSIDPPPETKPQVP